MCACLGDDGWFFFHLRLAALSSWEQSIRMLYCMWTLHKFTLNSKKNILGYHLEIVMFSLHFST
jgi:hypothetical protein